MGTMRAGALIAVLLCAVFVDAVPAGSVVEPVPVLRVNAGGPALAGAPGTPAWQADSASAPSTLGNGATVGAAQVRTTTSAVSVADPSIPAGTPAKVFQAVRADWRAAAPNLIYKLPTSKTQARLRLYFAELDDTIRAGGRVFDVLVEGVLVDDDLDVVARTGGVRRGIVRTYDVRVAGPTVDVVFRWKVKPPSVAGLELLEAPADPPPAGVVPVTRIDAGGAGAVADPPWTVDSPTALSSLSNAKAVGADQVATTTSAVDTSSSSIPAGTPPGIFRDVRVDKGLAKPNLAYVLPVDRAGTYVVRVYFVEVFAGYIGTKSRVQDVFVNGALVDNDLDIAGRAGGPLKAFARTYTVTADHQPAIQVEVGRVRQAPAIAAVELLRAGLEPIDRPGTWASAGAGPEAGRGRLHRARRLPVPGRRPDLRQVPGGRLDHQHDRYDPRTGEWTSLPPLPTAVDHVQGFAYQGLIWYVGGTTGGVGTGVPRGPTGQVTSYDPTTGEYTGARPCPDRGAPAASPSVDGRIYYFGGLISPTEQSPQADVYDIATDTWSELPDLPLARTTSRRR